MYEEKTKVINVRVTESDYKRLVTIATRNKASWEKNINVSRVVQDAIRMYCREKNV